MLARRIGLPVMLALSLILCATRTGDRDISRSNGDGISCQMNSRVYQYGQTWIKVPFDKLTNAFRSLAFPCEVLVFEDGWFFIPMLEMSAYYQRRTAIK